MRASMFSISTVFGVSTLGGLALAALLPMAALAQATAPSASRPCPACAPPLRLPRHGHHAKIKPGQPVELNGVEAPGSKNSTLDANNWPGPHPGIGGSDQAQKGALVPAVQRALPAVQRVGVGGQIGAGAQTMSAQGPGAAPPCGQAVDRAVGAGGPVQHSIPGCRHFHHDPYHPDRYHRHGSGAGPGVPGVGRGTAPRPRPCLRTVSTRDGRPLPPAEPCAPSGIPLPAGTQGTRTDGQPSARVCPPDCSSARR